MTKSFIAIHDIGAFGGAERYAAFLCSALLEQNHQVTMLTKPGTSVEDIENYYSVNLSGIRVKPVKPIFKFLPAEISRFFTDFFRYIYLKINRADYYFECSYKSEAFGGAKNNYYICHFPHQLTPVKLGRLRKKYFSAIKIVRNLLLGKGKGFQFSYQKILANSKYTQHYVLERWGVESSVLYPPCPVSNTKRAKTKKIISIGRFSEQVSNVPHKGQHYLIEAFSASEKLIREGWELHLVGSCRTESGEKYLNQLQSLSEGLPIVFHPNASYEQLQNLCAEAMIYWHAQGYGQNLEEHPETQEHFGITTVEAMSAGCIPIVIDSAGPKEVAENYGGETWKTLEELRQKTIEIAALSSDELARRQQQVRERADYFSEDRFRARVRNIL